jgi:uncharacterized protein YndB with AHSA1/START domain
MNIVHTETFHCPIDVLWRHIEDPELQKKWMKGLLENRLTSAGGPGVGSTFTMKIQEGRKPADYQGEMTAYEPPRHLGIRFWGGGFPAGMVVKVDYRLSAVEGGTRLDYACATEGRCLPWWLRLLRPLLAAFCKMQLRGFLKALRKLVEAPPAAAA